jgi:DNA-binding IclR family transcriptional regulator
MDLMSSLSLDSMSKAGAQGAPKALIKGLALVELVASQAPLRLVDLVEWSGLPRPTALRLLDALRDRDVLELTLAGEYVLGPRLAVWGQQYLEGLDLRAQAQDIMASLSSKTRETCFLGVRDGSHVLYVAKADSPQAVRPAARVGGLNPLHSTAIGKALLAFGPEGLVEGYLQEPLQMKTPNTITDPQKLRVELDTIRRLGYSTDDAENEDGVRCVAAAVMDHTGLTEAAISVSAPAYRFALEDLPRLAPQVIVAARELSRRIGFRSPDLRPARLSSSRADDEATQ